MDSTKELSHQQKSSIIRKEINKHYLEFKAKYPILKYQDAIGFMIFLCSVLGIMVMVYGYLQHEWSLWIVVPINAFLMGLLHELEHDLIHNLYFKKSTWMQHFMLGVGWLLRPLTINPWIRRTLHYHHHKYSGAIHDIEERGVTNGERWGWWRLIGTPDLLIAAIFRLMRFSHDVQRQDDINIDAQKIAKLKVISVLGVIPFTAISHLLVYCIIIMEIIGWGYTQGWWTVDCPTWWIVHTSWIYPTFYLLLLPNLIRQFSLHLITSNMHYFGDVEDGNVIEQTQILNVWWTIPFQLFCFFFGWTHAIHHFVVNETFYIRHFMRKPAQKIMIQYGVRKNDLGTFLRANRYHQH